MYKAPRMQSTTRRKEKKRKEGGEHGDLKQQMETRGLEKTKGFMSTIQIKI